MRKFHTPVLIAILLLVATLPACRSLNQITPKALDDPAIEAEIRANFAKDITLQTFSLGVSVDRGNVTLSGTVDNADQRRAAANAATSVDGVKSVINNIQIR